MQLLSWTGWNVIDPLLAIGISLVILAWSWRLFRDSVNILLEGAPKGMNVDEISTELKKEIPEIREINDMHLWVITSNMYSLTAHIMTDHANNRQSKEIIDRINALLSEKFDIEHTTIQLDSG